DRGRAARRGGDRCRERRAGGYGRCAVKKRKLIPWPKKKDSAKKHQHPAGPSQEVFDLACEILAVLCENGGTMDLHDVADEVLGPDGYVGADADTFDDAYGSLHGY